MADIIDISEYQENIDWPTLKQNCDFLIIRIDNGKRTDYHAEVHVQGAVAAGIPFYVYGYAQHGYCGQMALRMVSKGYNPLGYIADFEEGNLDNDDWESFVDAIHTIGDSERIGVYIANHLRADYALTENAADFIWVPSYGTVPNSGPCDLWQDRDNADCPGIAGVVDHSVIDSRTSPRYDLAWYLAEKSDKAQIFTPNGTDAQRFVPIHEATGIRLKSVSCGKFLDVSCGSTADGTVVQFFPENGTDAQLWTLEQFPGVFNPQSVAPYYLVSALDPNKVLDNTYASMALGNQVQLFSRNGSMAQAWSIIDRGDGTWNLCNVGSSMFLDVEGGGTKC